MYQEPLRPRFHFTPPRNFMNDPNGLVFYKGEYHLFYQHNPFGTVWGHMSWGHAVSRDMLHWEHLPVALREENGVMIFSGSAVVDRDNSSGFCRPEGADRSCLVAIYTGHGHDKQTQNLAYSNDRGRTWTKYAGNPVIDLGLKDFRDPKVFWHEPSKRWIMVTVLADQHKVRLFGSRDLKKWDTLSDFGPAGATGGVWECPDLFALPVDGDPKNVRWVLDVDINPGGVAGGSGGQYFVGTFDGTNVRERKPAGSDAVGRTRQGLLCDHLVRRYSAERRPPHLDGVDQQLALRQRGTDRDLARRAVGAARIDAPAAARWHPSGATADCGTEDTAHSTGPATIAAAAAVPGSADIEIDLARGNWREAGFRLSNAAGEAVDVGVSREPLELFVDRRRSRATAFHEEYPGRHASPVRWRDDKIQLRVLFDRSVIEVFANDGESIITDRVYPTQPLDHIELLPDGRSAVAARVWEMRSVWPER